MSNTLTAGYNPVAGEWYPTIEAPFPPVYFKFVRDDIIADVFPELVVAYCSSVEEVAAAIRDSIDDVVEVKLNADFEVELTAAGKIRTIQVPVGKTLIVDLNGHTYKNVAYHFYVLGTLIINDSKGTGKLIATYDKPDQAYPMIYVTGKNASVTVNGGLIQTWDETLDLTECYTYGIYAANDGKVNVGNKAKMKSFNAASISTNGSTGSGNIYISGDAVLEAVASSYSVYMPNQQEVIINGNAVLKGGLCARQGQITIGGNAKIYKSSHNAEGDIADFIKQGNNGYADTNHAIVLITGTYTSQNEELGNSMNVRITDKAQVISDAEIQAIAIATMNTGYDQVAKINITDPDNTGMPIIFTQDMLATMAQDKGYTYNPTVSTDLTVTAGGVVIYPPAETETEEG